MQTPTLDTAEPDIAGVVSTQPESPQPDQRKELLAELESEVVKLEAAFSRLDALRTEEAELVTACEQAGAEEARILADHEASERQSVDRLLRARALKDVRAERLSAHRKRVALHQDLIVHDLRAPLRKSFANFAHSLLVAKEAEMSELFYALLPNNSIPGLTNRDLVQACTPVVRRRQVLNWCNNPPRKEEQEELDQLKELPRRWLAALGELLPGQR
jgi:hypothetical protein